MIENKQFSAEEIEQIKKLQEKYNVLGIQLVQLKLAQKNTELYLKTLNEQDVNEVLQFNRLFSAWDTYYNFETQDIYFVGIKKGVNNYSLEKYVNKFVVRTSSNIR